MKKTVPLSIGAAMICLLAVMLNHSQSAHKTQTAYAFAPNTACTPPDKMASTPEETAWRLFVAASCPVNPDKYPYVVWENWIEQNQLYTPSGQLMTLAPEERPRFHMSPLARLMKRRNIGAETSKLLLEGANQDCNSGTFSRRTICEETRINPDAQTFITQNGLTTLKGQEAFVTAGKAFQFTTPSVEIKADWIQLPSCVNPPTDVHIEKVNNTCYALGGIHLISKLIDKWVWATFEPQNQSTNPRRCAVLGCSDSWGSNPASSSGSATQQTTAISQLMNEAGLAQEWHNYRLDGVQVDFIDSGAKATRLGNSIIEGDNAGNPTLMKSSSCITCHDFSTVNAQGQSLSPKFVVGPPQTIPAGYIRRDFVWSLSLAR